MLAARAHETRVVEIEAAIKAAAMSFKGGRHAEVIAPLEAALVGEPAGLRAATIRYYLGVAYAKTNVLDKAVANLTVAIAVEAEFPEVRFHLASALDRRGEYVKARAEYDRYATGHPQSSFAAFAMRRSATLARMPSRRSPAPRSSRRRSPSRGRTADRRARAHRRRPRRRDDARRRARRPPEAAMSALVVPPRARFSAEAIAVPASARARMEGVSWRGDDPRCPRWDALAYVTVDHVTFDGSSARGELVVAAELAARTIELFRRLWQLGFPIRQIALVDDYGASDDASMAADNSSAFNFRVVAGTDSLSQHALGRAIDINPVENPWRKPDRILPPAGAAFADRLDLRPGMFVRPGPAIASTDELGWEWGGDWRHASDDHHFVWRGR